MKAKNNDDILLLILEAAKDGETKTNIMYKSFISYELLGEYLSIAVDKGLMESKKGKLVYKTTEKGLKYLEVSNSKSQNLDHCITLDGYQKVLVIGLGQLGLPVAKYVKQREFDVYGYDINPKAMDRAKNTAGIKPATNFKDFDIYILCVSTHKPEDMFTPQVDGLLSIVDRISEEAKSGALVVIESTIPKGTSRKVFERLKHRLHVAHAPHRWYALEEEQHGVNQLRVVGGVHDCCLSVAMQFYDGRSENLVNQPVQKHQQQQQGLNAAHSGQKLGTITDTGANTNASVTASLSENEYVHYPSLGIPMHPVSEIEYAELTKIIENAHRYLQIAFAEDLYLYCVENDLSFAELREALNTKWNVNILEPRDGIGGHCLPKDTKMFIQSSNKIKSKILQAAMEVDEEYRRQRTIRGHRNQDTINVANAAP